MQDQDRGGNWVGPLFWALGLAALVLIIVLVMVFTGSTQPMVGLPGGK
jgi:hypothetical protein